MADHSFDASLKVYNQETVPTIDVVRERFTRWFDSSHKDAVQIEDRKIRSHITGLNATIKEQIKDLSFTAIGRDKMTIMLFHRAEELGEIRDGHGHVLSRGGIAPAWKNGLEAKVFTDMYRDRSLIISRLFTRDIPRSLDLLSRYGAGLTGSNPALASMIVSFGQEFLGTYGTKLAAGPLLVKSNGIVRATYLGLDPK